MKKIVVDNNSINQRIDKFVRKYFVTLPLSNIYKMLRKKDIKVNGKKVDQKYLLKEGDEITIFMTDENIKKLENDTMEKRKSGVVNVKPKFKVLYEDNDILIIDKPADIAVHAGTSVGNNNLINQVLSYLKYDATGFKPSLANRLDMQTSGIVLVGKTREALLKLNSDIKLRKVYKFYFALAHGVFKEKKGIISISLKRNYKSDKKFKVVKASSDEESQEAVTKYEVSKEWKNFSLLNLQLITGRTHQIRAHLAIKNHPIVGDTSYGIFSSNREIHKITGLKRHFLHSYNVVLNHPITGKKLDIKSELPQDLQNVIDWLDKKTYEKK